MNSKRLQDSKGVSPVIGVVLMVAITVILAAIIGVFVLNTGNVSENPQAGLNYNGNNTILIVQSGNVDGLFLVGANFSGNIPDNPIEALPDSITIDNPEAGDTFKLGDTALDKGDRFRVIGVVNGEQAVLQTYTYTGKSTGSPGFAG